ncbi:hypothetical protein Tco_0018510 [Tanacetum coccineum]
MPTNNTNNTTTTNVAQNVVNEDLPQLLDSRGVLENGPSVPMSPLSASKNPLIKPQKQWSPEDRKLANQDKRLKCIIISCLSNDVMKFFIKYTTAKAMWNDLILSHEGPYDTRDTKIAALRLKFNAFEALKGEKASSSKALISNNHLQDSDSDVEEDTRSSSEFLVDLNPEVVHESFDWHDESVSFEDEGTTRFKAFMAIAEDEPSVGKADARSGGRGKRKDVISPKEVLLTKANESPSKTIPMITSNSESECDNQEPLPPLPKLSGAEPIGILEDVITLADLTQTSSIFKKTKKVPDKESSVKAIKKKAQTKSPFVPNPSTIKKTNSSTEKLFLTLVKEVRGLKEQIKPPSDNSTSVSQTGSSKSAKGKQKTWFGPCKQCGFRNYLLEDCYIKPKCSTCGFTNHLTKEHPKQTVVKKTLAKLKAQSS